jgi:hypothetical protein
MPALVPRAVRGAACVPGDRQHHRPTAQDLPIEAWNASEDVEVDVEVLVEAHDPVMTARGDLLSRLRRFL